jgi:hypothetical protein
MSGMSRRSESQECVTQISINRTLAMFRHVLLSHASYTLFGPVTCWVYGTWLAMRRPLDLNCCPQAVEVVHTSTEGV